jgi:ketosteroid isomerase-like protein
VRYSASIRAALSIAVAGCSSATAPAVPDVAAIEAQAHDGYVAAINSNDLDTLMAVLTDDVVYQASGAPEVVGKAAVRDWVAGYLDAYSTRWEKTSIGFTVSGDWAFERYTYRATDTERATGGRHDRCRQGHQCLPARPGRRVARGHRRLELGQACRLTSDGPGRGAVTIDADPCRTAPTFGMKRLTATPGGRSADAGASPIQFLQLDRRACCDIQEP